MLESVQSFLFSQFEVHQGVVRITAKGDLFRHLLMRPLVLRLCSQRALHLERHYESNP